ncbi:uncharacterized protein YER152C-like isoform X2 [Pecten maximus]|uniref:uncharacterized protein YER152C-like isoform X2 n=1 Tax=Pecten maximus TaxID=6579 RepID=UPI001458C72B|nr:uncharacterized protein YER152C-like isoform X2 [Pecten maximus]
MDDRSVLDLQPSGNMTSFAMGSPGPATLKGCQDIMIRSTTLALKDPKHETNIFQYGPVQGDPTFRQELAAFLSKEYGDKVESESLLVTAGATNGLHLTVSTLFGHDVPIFVEDPTFFLAFKILKNDLGKTIIPAPTNEDGLDLIQLEEVFKENRKRAGDKTTWKCPFWTMLYTMTVFKNPTGMSSSQEQCRALIDLARKYDVLLFTDDVYNMFPYGKGSYPPRLLTYDKSETPQYTGCVLSNGTFSKIFAPGIRLGWIEGHKPLVNMLASCFQSITAGSFNHYTSLVMSAAIQLDLLSTHLNHIRGIYKTRMGLMCDALQKYLPNGCTFKRPEGGFFVWVTMPKEVDASILQASANKKYHVDFVDGEKTSVTRGYKNSIRLSISYNDTHQIEQGVQNLAKAIQTYMNSLKEATLLP